MTVRKASFKDYPQIVALQSDYGVEFKSFEEWCHLWSNNPAYKEYQSDLPIGWVLERDKHHVAGYLGNIPLFYELHGKRFLVSVAHSWVVEAQYRSYALFLLEEYFSQKIVDIFLNATVGPAASDSFAVFQSSPVPVGKWDRSSFWITNYHGFLAGWLAMKGIRLGKPLAYALSTGPFLRQAFSGSTFLKALNGINLQQCDQFDDRFDVFWAGLRKRQPDVLRAVRDREFLNWHFQGALQRGKVWILVSMSGSETTAYGIFLRQDSQKYGLKRVRLIDFQALDGSTHLLLSMLSWAFMRCRREGIHMLECIGFSADKQNVIANAAPYERKLPSWLYFYKATDQGLAERLSNPRVWDPSQFDGDASL